MVQRKVVNNKKHGIEGVTHKTDNKKQAITKSSIQNHDGKSKGADLKAVKMKKSRPVKRPNNVDEIISHHSTPMKTNKLVTPMKTPSPSPKKLLLPCKSPNYMKSTSSSEARKERSITSKESNTNSNSIAKLHKVGKTVNKLSNMKKMIGLTKSSSFKHTRSGGGGGGGRKKNKVVICEKDIDVQRATCSSTLKDCKFPTNLNKVKAEAGAGESEAAIGISSLSVCPYTYCSLNGNHHHHVSLPPLKRFLSSRRRLLRTRPQVASPRPWKGAIEEEEEEEEEKGDCEVQVYVPLPAIDRVRVRVREGGLGKVVSVCDEIDVSSDGDIDYDFGDDQTDDEDTTFPAVMNYPLQTQASFETQSSPIGDNSYLDMEWEEGNEDYYVHVETEEYSKKDDACFHQDIVEFLSFSSDTDDSLPSDNESGKDDKHTEEMVTNLNGMSSVSDSEPANEDIHLGNEAAAYTANLDDDDDEEESFMNEEGSEIIDSVADDGDKVLSDEGDVSQEDAVAFVKESIINIRGVPPKPIIADYFYADVIEFKPRSREPNFLAMKPDTEAEKVDLRHQQMDERRNADEWMLDYALQKTVTQLAPARNRKVALLVEAFESVLPPIPIFHPHSSHIISRNTSGFFNATPIQACR